MAGPRLLRKVAEQRQHVVGRLSDGSDRSVQSLTAWVVELVGEDGMVRVAEFDHDPTDEETLALVPAPRELTPSSRAAWERVLEGRYGAWRRWYDTRAEAQARGLAAAVITALTNRENAAWSDYLTALNAWRAAT